MRGQVNMVDEAKLCGTLHSTFEVLAVWCVAGCCCGGKSSPFCWPMAAAGNAVFSASYWFAKHTSQMKWFHMASESYSGSDWQQTTQQWPWLLFGGNRSLGKFFGASFQFNHWASCCCLSYKIHLLQKSYNKPRQQIKKQRHHFTNKGPSSQSYGFSSSHVQIWELDHGKGWAPKNWCFRVVVLEKTLESPSDSKETKPVKSKGNQPWIFIGRPDAEAEALILWPPDAKSWLTGKDPDARKDGRQEEKGATEDELFGWCHWFNGHEFEQTLETVKDREAWHAIVHGVAERQTWLNDSVQFSQSIMPDSFRPHEPQHARPPCPSPTPGVHPNPCPWSRWCHPTIPSSVIPFSSCPQSFPASGSFPMSQLFTSDGQSIGVSASTSVLQMNSKDWSPLEWTGWISLQFTGLSRVFSNTTVQKHQFFSAQLSL